MQIRKLLKNANVCDFFKKRQKLLIFLYKVKFIKHSKFERQNHKYLHFF